MENQSSSRGIRGLLDEVLPRLEDHWSGTTLAWGHSDCDIVEVLYAGSMVEEFAVRLDLREANPRLLAVVCRIAGLSNCCLRTEDGMLIEPQAELLAREMQQSTAFRFVTDPRGFLESFQGMPRLH